MGRSMIKREYEWAEDSEQEVHASGCRSTEENNTQVQRRIWLGKASQAYRNAAGEWGFTLEVSVQLMVSSVNRFTLFGAGIVGKTATKWTVVTRDVLISSILTTFQNMVHETDLHSCFRQGYQHCMNAMGWDSYYLDLTLSPAAFSLMIFYLAYLYMKFTRHPMSTIMGVNNRDRRAWVLSIMQDSEKKNILAVQTLRNSIMGSTLLATTAILLSSAIAAFLASTYDVKKQINSAVVGSESPISLSVKYMALLAGFLTAFLCYVQSVRFTNHVNFNINIPEDKRPGGVTADYVADLLERASNFHTMGTRAFYISIPMLLWLFGPIPFFVSTILLLPVWMRLDSAIGPSRNFSGNRDERSGDCMKKENGFRGEDDLRSSMC